MARESHNNLSPWKPAPTPISENWLQLIDRLENEVIGTPQQYVLRVKFDARKVGDLLASWGLPLPVVLAGYLMEYDKKLLRSANLEDMDEVFNHIREAFRYISYIEDEKLPPLLTPPYDDLGALLIAVAVNYQALSTLQLQSEGRPNKQRISWRVERTGNSLLNIVKRLGMWYFKREIEDTIEQLRNPEIFQDNRREYEYILHRDGEMLEEMRRLLITTYSEITGKPISVMNIPCGVTGLKRRLQDAHTTTTSQKSQLTGLDIVTFDVIVPTVRDCYIAFGTLSQLGLIQDRVTDQIAHPKNNGFSYIALGLMLNPGSSFINSYTLPTDQAQVYQLQIATHMMQAISYFGCLYPDCYQRYLKQYYEQPGKSTFSVIDFWDGNSGNVFQAIEKAALQAKPPLDTKSPIVVFDKNRTQIALPINATVLDFAYVLNSEIGELAVEAIVNNRKAPLYRILQAGDVVEILTARQAQADDTWLDQNYANTAWAKQEIQESIRRRYQQRRGYELLQQELRRYHYMLSLADLDNELGQLLKHAKLGTRLSFFERIENEQEAILTPNWAAQEIIKQISERKERITIERGREMWVPVIDTLLAQKKNGASRQRLCGQCRPSYPRDPKILGRLNRRRGELVVHRVTCAHLIDRPLGRHSMLIPMTWQLQSPAFIVAFAVMVQDRRGIIFDLTRQLRRHESDLMTINAEANNPKTGIGHLYFTIEVHSEQEVIDIWNEIYKIDNITEVMLDRSKTPGQICERLEKLRQQHETLSTKMIIEFAWEEQISSLPQRLQVLPGPFDISRPAAGAMFFGRSEEIKFMQRELCEAEQGRALILYGPRRSGKSSVCKHFLEHFIHEPCWGVLFSLQNARNHPETTIFMQLTEKISSTFQTNFQLPAPVWDDFSDSDPQMRFKRLLHAYLAKAPHSRLILILDEFGGAITSYEKGLLDFSFFTFWREVMAEIPQLSLVIALPTSSHQTLRTQEFGHVFTFALPRQMDFLDTESSKRLLADPLRKLDIAIHPNTVAMAVTLTSGNPYYLTLIGQHIITYLNLLVDKQVISDKDLSLVVEKLLMENVSQNFDYLKSELQDKEELLILEKMVDFMSHSNQIEVQLKKIAAIAGMPVAVARRYLDRMRLGMILNENGPPSNPFYSIKIDLIRRWLTHNRSFFTL